MLNRRQCALALLGGLPLLAAESVRAQIEAPDALVKRLFEQVLDKLNNDPDLRSGDLARAVALVDSDLMPHVNFARMTSSAVGRFWRQATPQQQALVQQEFKLLLVRTYAGALTELRNLTVRFRPMRGNPSDPEVLVRSEVRGRGDPIQLDYRLEKTPTGWKIYDLNVLGIWLVDTYRGQFAQEITANGIDGLIKALQERNQSSGSPKAA